MSKTKEEINKLVEELVSLGEDKDELNVWIELYELMPEENRVELANNLQSEIDHIKLTQDDSLVSSNPTVK